VQDPAADTLVGGGGAGRSATPLCPRDLAHVDRYTHDEWRRLTELGATVGTAGGLAGTFALMISNAVWVGMLGRSVATAWQPLLVLELAITPFIWLLARRLRRKLSPELQSKLRRLNRRHWPLLALPVILVVAALLVMLAIGDDSGWTGLGLFAGVMVLMGICHVVNKRVLGPLPMRR